MVADPQSGGRAGRAVILLIVAYVLIWWAYAVVAKGSQDIHFDMAEAFAWSLEPSFGYPKHPPFSAWVVAAWFAVVPRADWAYYLLSMTCVGVALWFVYLIARLFVTGHKLAVALTLLMLTPGFNFLALKYNPNSLLVPVWAGATWLFLRSRQERSALAGAFAGLGAAIAMLSKYWSIFLIIGFGAALLVDRRRADYFRSPAPYAAILVGALALAPHVASLVRADFAPFHYATAAHVAPGGLDVAKKIGSYLVGGLLYLSGSALLFVFVVRPRFSDWRDMLWSGDNDRRVIAALLIAALLAPLPVALATQTLLDPIWTVSSWALLPALVLSPAHKAVGRRAAAAALLAAYALPCLALAASPLVAIRVLHVGVDNSQIYFSLLSREVDRAWPTTSDRPLRYVTGDSGLAWGCTFYCHDRPRALPWFNESEAPWIDIADMKQSGFVALCRKDDPICLGRARDFAAANPNTREMTITLVRTMFGMRSEPRDFMILLAPPRG